MTAPTNPLTLDVAFAGAPWAEVKVLGSTDVQTLDVAFAGAPFAFAPGDFITGTATAATAACAVAATGTETFTGTCTANTTACAVASTGTETFTGTCTADTAACDCAGVGTVGTVTTTAAITAELDEAANPRNPDWKGWKKRAASLNPKPDKPKAPGRSRKLTPESEIPATPMPAFVPPPMPAPVEAEKPPVVEKPRKKRAVVARARRIFGKCSAQTAPHAVASTATTGFSGKAALTVRKGRDVLGFGAVVQPRTDEDDILSLIALMESMELEHA